MATLNPQVPDTQDPNYLSYSKGIPQPDFKSPLGVALKDVGNMIEGGIKGADEIIKAYSEDLTHKTITPLVEQEKHELEGVYNAVSNQPLDTNSTKTDMPKSLKDMPNMLGALQSAKANGTLSETHYKAAVDAAIKDVKGSVPPGYWDYVNQTASKITGYNVASGYQEALRADINTFLKQGNDQKNQALRAAETASHEGTSYEGLGGNYWVNHISNGGELQKFWDWQTKANAYKGKLATLKAGVESEEMVDKYNVKQVTNVANNVLSQKSTDFVMGMEQVAKAYGVLVDADGNVKGNPTQMQQYLQLVKQKEQEYYKAAELAGNEMVGGRPMKAWLGEDWFKRVQSYGKMFELAKDDITDEKSGRSGHIARIVKADAEHSEWQMTQGDSGYLFRAIAWAKKNADPETSKILLEQSVLPNLKSMDLNNHFKINMLKIVNGNSTMKDAFQKARDADMDVPKYLDELTDRVRKIVINPQNSVELRTNTLAALVDPKNRDFIAKLDPEYIDNKGVRHPGQAGIFALYTSKQFADSVNELGTKNPDIKNEYLDWVQSTARKELFQPALQKFGTMALGDESGVYQVTYNDKDFSFEVLGKNKESLNYTRKFIKTGEQVPFVSNTINNINSYAKSLATVGKSQGLSDEKINQFILQSILEGLPGGQNAENLKRIAEIPGIPAAMARAMSAKGIQDKFLKDAEEGVRKNFKKENKLKE